MKSVFPRGLSFLLGAVGVFGLASAYPASTAASTGATNAHLQGAQVPAELQPALYQALARDAGPGYDVGADGCVALRGKSLRACFAAGGAKFSADHAPALGLHLNAYGRGENLTPLASVSPRIDANTASYEHGTLTEWWKVLPLGFEQGFTLSRRPHGSGELILELASSHAVTAAADDLAWGALRYGKLVVTDAVGKVVPATLQGKGARILIAVNDIDAVYPLTVDPLLWLEQQVTAHDSAAGDEFGWSVAISGATALVSAQLATVNGRFGQGAVYVFAKANGVWSETQKLTASDGTAGANFGNAVAFRGTTAFVGAPLADAARGAVYVFTESNGTWAQTQRLTTSDGTAEEYFGAKMAFDGTTALITSYATIGGNARQGAVYVFTGSNGAWSQTQKLVASDGAAADLFGFSVALAGNTALVGANHASVNGNDLQGAAYLFAKSGGIWSQTAKLLAIDGAADSYFGYSVALSGTTALVGALGVTVNGNQYQGAAYVFDGTGGAWSQTRKLVASDGAASDYFGTAVALSGSTALVGAGNARNQQGAVYVFSNSGGTWSEVQELVPSDAAGGSDFGKTLALDGMAALIGAPYGAIGGGDTRGVAYFYIPSEPRVASVTPAAINFALLPGATGSAPLTIANTGGGNLNYAIAEAPASAPRVQMNLRSTARSGAVNTLSAMPSNRMTAPHDVAPWTPRSIDDSLSFVLDDGIYERALGLNDQANTESAAIWLNRFSPTAGTGAFTIDSISIMWPQNTNGPLAGKQVNLVAYYDAGSTGNPANAVRLGNDHFVTIANLDAFVEYTVNFSVPGDGDIYVGFENTYALGGTSPILYPAAIDTNSTLRARSWVVGASSGDPDPDTLGNNDIRGTIDSLGLPGNWLIRATGTPAGAGVGCSFPSDVPWLSESPVSGSVAGGASQQVTVTADATGLSPGAHAAILCVTTSDPARSLIQVPVSLTVGAGDSIFDDGFDGT